MISCILTSYNRPRLVRQALRSVEQQTYKNYELIVMDESGAFDIHEAVREFRFPKLSVRHCDVSAAERAGANRLSLNINAALGMASGDLICYLADDDYFFGDWFEHAALFFRKDPKALQGFGSLIYSQSLNMDYSQAGSVRFFDQPVTSPLGKLDHGMVMHRRRTPAVLWPAGEEAILTPDGLFFDRLAQEGPFFPIMDASAVVKRIHPKNLQKTLGGSLEGLRE